MVSILLAVRWIQDATPLRSVICSDSSLLLASLQDSHSDCRADILIEIHQTLSTITMMGLMADRTAKEATKRPMVDMDISGTEIKSRIWHKMKERCQKQWEEERKGRCFYRIQRKIEEIRSTGTNGKEETVISPLRFGHTSLNNTLFLMGKHRTGECDCSREQETEHVLLHCQKYDAERR